MKPKQKGRGSATIVLGKAREANLSEAKGEG